ncbi:MAG: 30S ribosomal protein S21 [Dehalococcoidia bacterium]
MAEVIIDGHESIESALRRFNKKVQSDGILSEYRRRQYFEKPSVVRKKKRATKKRKSSRSS